MYHTTFDWPVESTIQQRLIVPEHNTEEDLVNRLIVYHRHVGGIEDSFKASLKPINADQPKGDVMNQSENILKKFLSLNISLLAYILLNNKSIGFRE